MPAAWKPEAVAELMRLARAGDSWEAIGTYFYPQSANAWRAARSAAEAFRRHAISCDIAIRRRALQRRNWNKLPGISEWADRRRRKQHRDERPVQRERRDPLHGMGLSFA